MTDIQVNGARVATMSLTIPTYGPWSADLVMPTDVAIGSAALAATLKVGDLTLRGSVTKQAAFDGDTSARLVGGAGGWRKVLPPKGYAHTAGVKLSSVAIDAARESGETITVPVDRTLGVHYVRDQAKAEGVLHLLLDGRWWIHPDGSTRVAARDSSPIVTPFTVIRRWSAKGQFEIATDAIAPWQPGRTFTSSTVPVAQTISSVSIDVSNDGKLRLQVLTVDGEAERLRAGVVALIRSEMAPVNYAGEWEYTIAAATETTVDVVPSDTRMPQITGCPMVPGLIGELVTPTVGSKCRVVFVNQNPARPECVRIIGAPVLAKLGGGADFVALAAKVATELGAIRMIYNGHTHVETGTTTAVPVPLIVAPGSVAATKVKAT